MSLPRRPALLPAVVIRHKGLLKGEVQPGEVLAWEPDLPYARELIIVRRVYMRERGTNWHEPWVETWDMQYTKTCMNSMDRIREACFRTNHNLMPAEPPAIFCTPPPELIAILERHSRGLTR